MPGHYALSSTDLPISSYALALLSSYVHSRYSTRLSSYALRCCPATHTHAVLTCLYPPTHY
eukprot:3940257-Rhodomonas_salina.5